MVQEGVCIISYTHNYLFSNFHGVTFLGLCHLQELDLAKTATSDDGVRLITGMSKTIVDIIVLVL